MAAASKKKSGKPAGKPASKQVTVTLMRSVHGQLKNIAASVRGLGLRKPHQSVIVADTAENRGMMHVAGHLLKVEHN
jgi:large subunit ribosomal protein L30